MILMVHLGGSQGHPYSYIPGASRALTVGTPYARAARTQVMVPQLPLNAARPLPPDLEGGENEVPQIRGVFLNYEPIHTKNWL